jgi:hypothetical protein
MAAGRMKRRAFIAATLSLSTWSCRVDAHDIYTDLKDSSGGSCCATDDCRPAHYRITATGVEMLVDGQWIVVPKETIQYRTLKGDSGETAGGHWCGLREYGATYCAILPPRSSLLGQGRGAGPASETHTDE